SFCIWAKSRKRIERHLLNTLVTILEEKQQSRNDLDVSYFAQRLSGHCPHFVVRVVEILVRQRASNFRFNQGLVALRLISDQIAKLMRRLTLFVGRAFFQSIQA